MCCSLQELKSTAASLLIDAVFDDPWTNALTQCLAAHDYVRVSAGLEIGGGGETTGLGDGSPPPVSRGK